MFEKGTELEIEITDVSDRAVGIGHKDGFTVFVPGCLPGDRVRARLAKVKKNYAVAENAGLISASPDRIHAVCPYADDCGGCPYAGYSYDAQLRLKEKQVRDKLSRIGGVKDPLVREITGMDDPFAYRNKAVMRISTGGNIKRKGGIIENLGEPAVGFLSARTHDVVDCETCRMQNGASMAAAGAMRRFMREDNITAWDEKWRQGLMRDMTVRTAFGTGEVMVTVRINGRGIPNAEKLVYMIDDGVAAAGYSLESFYIDNDRDLINIAGDSVIRERTGNGTMFEISPASFYQVNPSMMERLYDKVREYADLRSGDVLLDLYCGVGTIGLWCARDAGYVIGIEKERQAVLDANRNAAINGIVNARYIEGAAEEIMEKAAEGDASGVGEELTGMIREADTVVLDPPRKGCGEDMIKALTALGPKKIIYVSCDPATLSRDVKKLTEGGYALAGAAPVDMFPWTLHVECVALLSRAEQVRAAKES